MIMKLFKKLRNPNKEKCPVCKIDFTIDDSDFDDTGQYWEVSCKKCGLEGNLYENGELWVKE